MHDITLLRHGESEGNSLGVLQGQDDSPLSSVGIQQSLTVADFWKLAGVIFDLLICSTLQRASQTASILSSKLNCPIELDPDWKERNFGELQGAVIEEIAQRTPIVDFFQPYEPVGGTGESQLDLYLRAGLALQKIIRKPPGRYLVISHGAILNKALYVVLGITRQGHYNSPLFRFDNAGYAQPLYKSVTRQWAVICLNNRAPELDTRSPEAWSQE